MDSQGQEDFKMKIRPKPRKYQGDEELDESYFAARSNGDAESKDDSITDSGLTS